MGIQLFTNNASTTISGTLTTGSTAVTLGSAAAFPTPANGDWFIATLQKIVADIVTAYEIVKVTAVVSNVATIERAQEGTAALTWANGDTFALLPTAGGMAQFLQQDSLYPITAEEIAEGATIVNGDLPPCYVDRYKDNAIPGTTDMGTALNTAIAVALAVKGSGQNGIPVILLNGAYSIATQPVFGTVNPNNMLPLVIEGQGWGTQLICNTPPSTPLFDMGGRIGWKLGNFYQMGNDAHKNDGIHAGAIGGTLQTQWVIENVYSQMAGENFKVADTNSGRITGCMAWVTQPPEQIVPQTVTPSNISYMLHLSGSFVNNLSVRDCNFLPNHNNLTNTAVLMDCTTSEAVEFDTINVESGSGANTENGFVVSTSSSITGLSLKNIYCEGTDISLTGVFNSYFECINDGGTGGSLALQSQCRDNTFVGTNLASITDNSATNFGNTFMGCLARGQSEVTTGASGTGTVATVTFGGSLVIAPGTIINVAGMTPAGYNGNNQIVTASSAGSVSFANATTGAQTVAGTVTFAWNELVPGNSRRINCTGLNGVAFVDWGGSAINVIPYTSTMTPACNASKGAFGISVTSGTNLTIAKPINPVDGYLLSLTIEIAFASPGTITYDPVYHFAGGSAPGVPANGQNYTVNFRYNATHTNWRESNRATGVAN